MNTMPQVSNETLHLPEGEIHLWSANVQDFAVAELIVIAQEWLSERELARYQCLQVAAQRHRFLLGRWLLRQTLSRYLGSEPAQWQFVENEYGKPALASANAQLQFNLTHSGDFIVLVLATNHELGVDIEYSHRERRFQALGERHFSATEVAALQRCAASSDSSLQQHYFYQLWTLKEACLKAVGSGLVLPLDGFSFDLSQPKNLHMDVNASVQTSAKSSGHWQVWQLEFAADYELAVALRSQERLTTQLASWRCKDFQAIEKCDLSIRRQL